MKIETLLTTKASEELAKEVKKDLEKEDVAIATILDKCERENCGGKCKGTRQA